MRLFLGSLLLLVLGCVKEQPEPEFLVISSQPTLVYQDDTPIHYFYNSSGDLIRKEQDTFLVEYIYDNYHKRNEVMEQSSDIRNFRYTSLGLGSIDSFTFQYGATSTCRYIINNIGASYEDSIYVLASPDTIRLIRNSVFASIKYRTTHLFYKDITTKEYCLVRSNIAYFSESQQRYVSTYAEPEFVARIFYTKKIPVKIKRPVREDLFRLSDLVVSGSGFSKISKIELLYLEEFLPELLPVSVITQLELVQYEYTFDKEYVLERLRVTREPVNIEDASLPSILFKFQYPHE